MPGLKDESEGAESEVAEQNAAVIDLVRLLCQHLAMTGATAERIVVAVREVPATSIGLKSVVWLLFFWKSGGADDTSTREVDDSGWLPMSNEHRQEDS